MATVEERVAAGAAWLDETRPGWERKVDLASLALESMCRCVLGQVFGGYYIATGAHEDIRPASFGFTIFGRGEDFALLDEAWIALIKERFASGILSDEA